MIVYKSTNKDNGKVYIGQTIKGLSIRKTQHIHKSQNGGASHFHCAIRKHGTDTFKWEILRICNNINEVNAWEQYYILYYDSMNVGYNLTNGGLNYIRSDESKQKMRIFRTGKKHSEKTCEKIRQIHLGRKHSKEQIEKFKIATKGEKHWNYGNREKDTPAYGRHHTTEVKRKISEGNLGKTVLIETRQKISKARMGMTFSNEHRKNLSISHMGIVSGLLGKSLSEETRKKISESLKIYYKKKRNKQ